MVLPLVLAALALVGLANALYFTAVTYRWMRPDPAWLPRVCRMDEATCARVVDTPQARALGVPNSVLGALWYVVVLGVAAMPGVLGYPLLGPALLLVAAGTVGFSAWLAWALVVRLRVLCPLCFLGHGVNAGIAAVMLGMG